MERSTQLVILGLVVAFGCAHAPSRGSVAMRSSEDEVHVSLGDSEVRAGDQLSFYRNACYPPQKKTHNWYHEVEDCSRFKIGDGQVVRTLDHNFSVARVSPGMSFDSETVVEKD